MRRTVLLVVLALWPAVVGAQSTAPDRRDVVQAVSDADPARFACAHVESRLCKLDWIQAVAVELYKIDQRWGLNGKRGNPDDISMDVVTFRVGPTDRHVEAFDVCGGCGGGNPSVTWNNITNYATMGQPGTAIWVAPVVKVSEPGPIDPPPPAPTVDLRPVLDAIAALVVKVDAVAGLALAARDAALDAKSEAEQAKTNASDVKHLAVPELKTLIERAGLTGCLVGRVPKTFGGSTEVRFCPAAP